MSESSERLGLNAVFSDDRLHRYALWRDFLFGDGNLLFVMLNPSTADETKNDPTVRRCIGFAETWGYRSLAVANIFAFRSTDPKKLSCAEDPIGPENDKWIVRLAGEADRIVLAWGADPVARERGLDVLRLLSDHKLYALERTQHGAPRHPLYVRAATRPQLFAEPREAVASPRQGAHGPLELLGSGWELNSVDEVRIGHWAACVRAPDGREETRSALTAVAAVDSAIAALDPSLLPDRGTLSLAIESLGSAEIANA